MKQFKQLVKELPAKKVIFAFGRYQPPTIGHGLLVAAVKHLAEKQGADHVIYASKTQDKKSNPLPVDRKVYYLKRMFPGTNFVEASADVATFIQAVKQLNKKYKNLVMVAGSDRVAEYQKILTKYNGKDFNYDTIEVVSAGERDPDADGASGMSGTKMREAAKKGDFALFKKGLPSTLTTLDAKRLMNELREAMGLEQIREQLQLNTNKLREQYRNGDIFNIGEKVEDSAGVYEIVDRGTNYISVVNESGEVLKKWIHGVQYAKQVQEDIQPGVAPEEITFKGYTTKNLHHSEDAVKAFQSTIDKLNKGLIANDPVAVLNALKATDTYMGLNDLHLEQGKDPDEKEIEVWKDAHKKAQDALLRVGEFLHHEDYWHMHLHELEAMETKYNPEAAGHEMADSYNAEGQLVEMKFTASDKIKVARVIASALGVQDVDKSSNAEMLINNGLRKIRSKPMRPEYVDVLHKMLQTAQEAGIEYDTKLVPQKANEGVIQPNGTDKVGAPVNTSDVEAKVAAKKHAANTQGHSLVTPDESSAVRKMKVRYATEEVELGEGVDGAPAGDMGVMPAGAPQPYDAMVQEDDEEDDIDDKELDKMVDSLEDDDILDAYEDDEFAVVDDETGEEVEDEDEKKVNEQALMEVLTRAERMRAKIRFAKSKSKRERKLKIALKSRSTTKTINNRARKLAVKLMKQRIAKKPLNTLSVAEKERIEKIVQRRKAVINRLAMKLVPRVKKAESDRLTHKVYTK